MRILVYVSILVLMDLSFLHKGEVEDEHIH